LAVAALAGLPRSVLDQARQVLQRLEQGEDPMTPDTRTTHPENSQLGLFTSLPSSAVEQALQKIDPDALSPREALDLLYRLHALLR